MQASMQANESLTRPPLKNVLVTGGAGYIGSHTAAQLVDAGHRVTVVDNLDTGHRWAVPKDAAFEIADIADRAAISRIIVGQKIDAVIHFAAHVVVPESVADPTKYHRNNVLGSLNLIEACLDGGVSQFVFSSSAAVYGNPRENPVAETADLAPINPYGNTKLITESMLRDVAAAPPPNKNGNDNDHFRFVALRYFNVAGAREDGTLGQATPRATHLIKAACEAACKVREELAIFGDDYPTADGTCIRDYIHVEDLARAHLDAFAYLDRGGASIALNCGYGRGYSVREVIDCVKAVSGVDFAVRIAERRAGDPPQLIADNTAICREFDWKPRYADLSVICRSAYRWEKSLPQRQR